MFSPESASESVSWQMSNSDRKSVSMPEAQESGLRPLLACVPSALSGPPALPAACMLQPSQCACAAQSCLCSHRVGCPAVHVCPSGEVLETLDPQHSQLLRFLRVLLSAPSSSLAWLQFPGGFAHKCGVTVNLPSPSHSHPCVVR